MKRFFYIIFLNLILIQFVNATHERAGEIIFTHIFDRTYEIKIITYTYAPSPADRPELEIKWGDGTSSILPRSGFVDLTLEIRRNEYIGQHTYAGNGSFKISLEDPNRNYGIVNIPNSVNIPFYIETLLIINPFLGGNSSPVLLNPPLDYGCVNRLYVHNPAAFDPDGDSLSYRLTVCRGVNGLPIPGYSFPLASSSFSIDEFTGDLIWDKPVIQGEYNVAFIIEEWRNGQRIGYVTRDLQIKIDACSNNPPVIYSLNDTCIIAGQNLQFEVSAIDPDGDLVALSGKGSPFIQEESPAIMQPNPAYGNGEVTAEFSWNTKCSHVQKNPHQLYLKARDSLVSDVQLTAYKTVNISVIGPSPEISAAIPLGNSITLQWVPYECQNATAYRIYRKDSFFGYTPAYCETGVPAYTGYNKIADINTLTQTEYTDDNGGLGLIHGIEYCYMITAIFPGNVESLASLEWCALLKKDLPVITNVSIEKTDASNGEIYVAWSKPTELDTIQIPGPYKYEVTRNNPLQGNDYITVGALNDLNDTTFNDIPIPTLIDNYKYKIDLYSGVGQDEFKVGSTSPAPSIFLSTYGTDKAIELTWNNNVPWYNEEFTIYRQNKVTLDFDSIGSSLIPVFTDTGLVNSIEYCYKIKSIGRYASPGIINPIINFSQENCGIPIDNVAPCAPVLQVQTNCEIYENDLSWDYPDSCANEELTYYIYYAGLNEDDFQLFDSTQNNYYTFSVTPPTVVGCFTITALDSLYNQSVFSNLECVDINECGRIWFPNFMSPNGDTYNDYFSADSVNSVHSLSLRIFNRWGSIVYETEDPFFQWDGRDQNNNSDCSPGVYFYEGVVAEYTLRGPVERVVKGNVTLLR
ncbi:MAG: gliding motility-associated C-terminal domain-containing protein [Bacteroidales bacterium]|nr:gliding motility-associated C-terminal domain-containing protein [Bacteroidales bacterium]MCF8403663.1 gliding motility-associated C-terminal domain-containing protein [Bacteroidales bacterium]